jgi:predicted nucleic acid-binding protein
MTPGIPGAVFDCVVLLQAAVSKKGPAFACLRLAQAGQVRIALSSDILAEITDVLNRPELRRKFKSLTSDSLACSAGSFSREPVGAECDQELEVREQAFLIETSLDRTAGQAR